MRKSKNPAVAWALGLSDAERGYICEFLEAELEGPRRDRSARARALILRTAVSGRTIKASAQTLGISGARFTQLIEDAFRSYRLLATRWGFGPIGPSSDLTLRCVVAGIARAVGA